MEYAVQADGASLHVEVEGKESNPALLLWPPGSSTVRVWDHLVPQLSERFFVVRADIRGYGKSVPHNHDEAQFCFEQYALDAGAVLDFLDIEKCHVWSQSWGSRPAMFFSATHPARVLSAALYAANTEMPDVPAQREGTRKAAELRKELGISSMSPSAGFREHEDVVAAQLTASATQKFDLNTVVEKLSMPVLIGTGDHDPNLVSSRTIAARLPNANLVVFEHVGHNAILEYPDLALTTFLNFQDNLDRT